MIHDSGRDIVPRVSTVLVAAQILLDSLDIERPICSLHPDDSLY